MNRRAGLASDLSRWARSTEHPGSKHKRISLRGGMRPLILLSVGLPLFAADYATLPEVCTDHACIENLHIQYPVIITGVLRSKVSLPNATLTFTMIDSHVNILGTCVTFLLARLGAGQAWKFQADCLDNNMAAIQSLSITAGGTESTELIPALTWNFWLARKWRKAYGIH